MRKWNKLLALVLAMVMVFGLTATAFAAESDKDGEATPISETEPTTPAAGDDDKAPAEGDDAAAPAEGDDAAAPAEGEGDAAPAEGEGDNAAPAPDAAPAPAYTDVSAWAVDAVAAVAAKGLIAGVSDTEFGATAAMTRADLVSALYILAGSPANAEDAENPFADVADDAAYKAAVIWAKDQGIVSGRNATTFDPTGSVSRQEIAKILFEYAKAEKVEGDNISIFTDAASIADWAKDYVNWAVASKLISGNKAEQNTVKMDPNGTATREQVAVILMRYINEVLPAAPADDANAPADDANAPAEGDDADKADDAADKADDAADKADDAADKADDAADKADDAADKADDAADKADDAADKADDKAE